MVNHFNKSSNEFKKIDKDVLRITKSSEKVLSLENSMDIIDPPILDL